MVFCIYIETGMRFPRKDLPDPVHCDDHGPSHILQCLVDPDHHIIRFVFRILERDHIPNTNVQILRDTGTDHHFIIALRYPSFHYLGRSRIIHIIIGRCAHIHFAITLHYRRRIIGNSQHGVYTVQLAHRISQFLVIQAVTVIFYHCRAHFDTHDIHDRLRISPEIFIHTKAHQRGYRKQSHNKDHQQVSAQTAKGFFQCQYHWDRKRTRFKREEILSEIVCIDPAAKRIQNTHFFISPADRSCH